MASRGLGRWRIFGERIEQFQNAEVVDGGTEKDGRLSAGQIFVQIELVAGAFHQVDFVP